MPTLSEDGLVRGGVYLCQTGPCASCGSCCGLYNMTGLSRERLHAILAERTRTFAEVPRTVEAILAFERRRMELEGADYPVADFHHCVFTGLIRDGGERIGCLLHPLATDNAGVDWRGLSYYGGAACKHFFCPTYDELDARWKRLVREVLDDWYEYGLIIPEHRFLAAALGVLESRLGRPLDAADADGDGKKALRELFRLKLDWPFRNADTPLAWNFFSTRRTERPAFPDRGDDPQLTIILGELDTRPDDAEKARDELATLLDRTATALAGK